MFLVIIATRSPNFVHLQNIERDESCTKFALFLVPHQTGTTRSFVETGQFWSAGVSVDPQWKFQLDRTWTNSTGRAVRADVGTRNLRLEM